MRTLDKILEFLLRTRLGNLVLIVAIGSVIALFTGCLGPDCTACLAEKAGCERCATCANNCNAKIDSCGQAACSGDCANCVYGDGCVHSCSNGEIVDCGGCNRTLCTDCSTLGKGCSFGNCRFYEDIGGIVKQDTRITIIFLVYDAPEWKEVTHSEISYEMRDRVGQLPVQGVFNTYLYELEGIYFHRTFENESPCANERGNWISKYEIADAEGKEILIDGRRVFDCVLYAKLVFRN